MDDAIKEIIFFMDKFPEIASFQIIDCDNIVLHLNDTDEYYCKYFKSSIELKDWCEANLEMKIKK